MHAGLHRGEGEEGEAEEVVLRATIAIIANSN